MKKKTQAKSAPAKRPAKASVSKAAPTPKAKAPAKPRIVRTLKRPVHLSETVTIALDTTDTILTNGSTKKWTSYTLIKRACEVSGMTPEAIILQGALFNAKKLVTHATKLAEQAESGAAGRGRPGTSNARLLTAYNGLLSSGHLPETITPTRLLEHSFKLDPTVKPGYRSTLRFLQIHNLGPFSQKKA